MDPLRVVETRIGDVPARIATVSFTGGPAFEVSVPAPAAAALWDAGLRAGAVPFGTEAMHVLRAEMGYFMIGQETDGAVTPLDLGLERLVAWDKEFIGRRSLRRPALARSDRRQLVGLAPLAPVGEGAQIVPGPGHVTSSYRGAVLAMLSNGRARLDEMVEVLFEGRSVSARVVEPRFAALPAASEAGGAALALDIPPDLAAPRMISLRAAPDAVAATLGIAAPSFDRVADAGGFRVLRLGPDEWLVVGEADCGELRAVDVTHNRVIIPVADRATLAKGCGLDLDPRAFPAGYCAQTLLARTQVILEARAEAVLVYARPSFAAYLRDWLADASG
jgi:sarcosine oxidase subunit alpha